MAAVIWTVRATIITAARWPPRERLWVVTFNYRLYLMGWLAVPSLDSEGHTFGNYGLLDQQMMLNWVRQNITAFGGDPSNVTVGGQSAGAEDTGLAMLSPGASGLFQHGICESSARRAICRRSRPPKRSARNSQPRPVAAARPARRRAQCLRAVPASEVRPWPERGVPPAPMSSPDARRHRDSDPATDRLGQRPVHACAANERQCAGRRRFQPRINEYFSHPRQPPTVAQYTTASPINIPRRPTRPAPPPRC